MVMAANAVNAGASNALDLGFGGKGKILEGWTKIVWGENIEMEKPKKKIMTDRAAQFFNSLPKMQEV